MYAVKLTVEYFLIPDGASGAALGQRQSNWPGAGVLGASAGPVAFAQSASDYALEIVPGGDTPVNTNFQTALNTAAADLYTQFITTNDVPGFTSGTLFNQVSQWATGGP